LFLISTSLKVNLRVKNCTDTLEIGSRAPDFSVEAANREGRFTLTALLAEGALILEFLRGTW
jgi:peroxiredoxin